MKKPPMGPPPEGFKPPIADLSGVRRMELDIPYAGDSPAQRLDMFWPETGEGPFTTLVYVHGGGFALGDKRDSHLNGYLPCLARGFALAAVEYRLSGEAAFPAAVLDCRSAVRFLIANAARLRVDPERLCAIGGSAGGNLAAMLGMNIPVFPGEGDVRGPQPVVQAAVDQFGPMDFRAMDAQARANGVSFDDHDGPDSPESKYLGAPVQQADNAAQADPLTYAGPAMCPMLVQHGTADRLVPFAQSEAFVEGLRAKGLGERVTFTPLPGADHEGPAFFAPENTALVLDFIEAQLCRKER